jgi:predicted RNase H-like HicB family nuclease
MIEHRGYKISIEKTRTGYGAVITPEVAVCVTGKTKAETTRLAREGIDLWIEFAPMSFEEAMAGAPMAERRRLAANRAKRRIVRAVR